MPHTQPRIESSQTTDGDAPSILLVDDRPENLLALEEVLSPLSLTLVRAGSGEEALRRVLERDFAAILMDVQMPGMDGFQTAQMILQRPRSRSIPIVFLTAIDASPDRIRQGYAAGGVDFIHKPFEPAILRAKVGVFAELHARGRQVEALAAQAAAAAEQLRAAETVRTANEQVQQAREQAEESEARFRTLAETIPQLAWMAEPDGSITWYNRRWYEYTGTTPEQMLGWGWKAVHHPEQLERVVEHFRAAITSGQPWEDTFPLRGADGEYRWFLSRALPQRDDEGRIVRWFGTNTDVEEQRRAEAERDRALTEAHAARRAADTANRAKSQFLANMSHEIRTPINAILGYTELLEMGISGPLNEKQQAQLGRVRGSGAHLLGLVNDILDLSKVEAGEMSFICNPSPARAIADEALSMVGPQAEARGLKLSDASDCPGDVTYLGDPDRVRQILVNLLSNAVKFTERGSVTLRCHVAESRTGARSGGPWVAFEVQDTGIGIAPEQLARVFEPFVQVEEGHTRTQGGTGLGLTISRRFARLMGGELTVKSALGEGSCFTLWLPADAGQAAETAQPDRAEAWRTRAGEVQGLADLGRIITERADEVVRTLNARLREDGTVPGARELDDAQLENHIVTFLTDLGKTLVTLDAGDGEPDLLRDGMDIKRLISVRHGEQRCRLGWGPQHVRLEYAMIREEVQALVRREAPARTGADVGEALGVVTRLLDASERMALGALEDARKESGG
ncbi:MAG TPA: ATP-binding protein [Longimicrobium sp.]|nr:ATP-binding protein [Longimicrobium sp.]